MTAPLAVGVDLGGTNLRVALVDREGRVVTSLSRPTLAERGPDRVIGEIIELVEELRRSGGIDRASVVGVGVGAPGPLNLRAGTIVRSANLPGWIDVPIRERLSNALRLPVALDNDANAAALGEWRFGAGRDFRDFTLFTLGTGIGCGVVVDGRLLHGHFDNAAELGHMIVIPDGQPCPCGQRGCLEQYASATAVARRAATFGGGGETLDARTVAQRAAEGDGACRRAWDEACDFLAVACINVQHAYNPAVIAFGGGMSEAGAFLLNGVVDRFRFRRWKLLEDSPEITLAKLGSVAGVVGAAAMLF